MSEYRPAGQSAHVAYVDARTLIPSPENEVLYRERTPADADFARLIESVRLGGVQAPLLVSLDGYIVSGHQRRPGRHPHGPAHRAHSPAQDSPL